MASNIGFHRVGFAVAAAVMLAGAPASAAEALSIQGGEQKAVAYNCKPDSTMDVTYVNAASESLAIVPLEGEKRIFVSVLAGSGVRYVSGVYVWWSKGRQASLYDIRHGENAPAVFVCDESE